MHFDTSSSSVSKMELSIKHTQFCTFVNEKKSLLSYLISFYICLYSPKKPTNCSKIIIQYLHDLIYVSHFIGAKVLTSDSHCIPLQNTMQQNASNLDKCTYFYFTFVLMYLLSLHNNPHYLHFHARVNK